MFDVVGFINCANSSDVNCGPLSDTSCSGIPYAANSCRSILTVLVVEVQFISKTLGHFEWASTMTRNDLPKNGPANSIWTRCHGFVGQVHGCSGDFGGVFLCFWHSRQAFATLSMSESMPGHHIKLRARVFMRELPR